MYQRRSRTGFFSEVGGPGKAESRSLPEIVARMCGVAAQCSRAATDAGPIEMLIRLQVRGLMRTAAP